MRPVVETTAYFPIDERIRALCELLAQQVWHLPLAEGDDELWQLARELAVVFDQTEEGKQQAVAENARKGLRWPTDPNDKSQDSARVSYRFKVNDAGWVCRGKSRKRDDHTLLINGG